MDQVEDEYYLPRKKPGRKNAGSTDCTGRNTTELDKILCPALFGRTQDIKEFCSYSKQILKMHLKVSKNLWYMQECFSFKKKPII